MKTIRPLIIQKLGLVIPGARIYQLRIHRHLPEAKIFRSHLHHYAQLLLYLEGGGHQRIEEETYPIRSGTLFYIPRNTSHSFRELGKRRPLCLIIDIEISKKSPLLLQNQTLPADQLRRVKSLLAELSRHQQQQFSYEWIKLPALALDILYELLCFQSNSPAKPANNEHSFLRRTRQLIRSQGFGHYTLGEVAKIIGFQKDYFNRLLKRHAGLTFGALEGQEFLKLSMLELKKEKSIREVAEGLGFPDQNYFARWFRRQTGVSPTQWKSKFF